MSIFELLITVVIVSICVYVIVDRICNCVEHCFTSKQIYDYLMTPNDEEKEVDDD